ncbi:MAG: hypothetical protein ACT4OV_16190 [Microthrixaceae bacterium]
MCRIRWWPLALIATVVLVVQGGVTGANVVSPTKAGESTRAITPNDLKPTQCATPNLVAKVSGSGVFSGTSSAELLTGSAAIDTITAGGGPDCVMGGAGNDSLNGGNGTDVCIGGAGTDVFTSCETQIQ